MDNRQYEDSIYLEENSYSRYMNARSQQPQDLVVKFINYCATLLQKNIKGFQQRQKHKIIMMHIRRFKSLLNAHIAGYKIRKILRLNDVNNLKQDILETDDGTYGNPQIRQKKIKLIRSINQHFETGSYAKLKKQKSIKQISTKPFVKKPFSSQSNFQEIDNNIPNLSNDQNRLQTRQFQPSYQNTIVQNQSSTDFNNTDRQYQPSNTLRPSQNYQNYEDYRQNVAKPQDNYNDYQQTDYSANVYKQPSNYNNYQENDNQITPKPYLNYDDTDRAKPQQNQNDDRPIISKPKQNYSNYDDDRPITSKPKQTYAEFDDDRPITSKPIQNYADYDDDRPITSKPKQNYADFDDDRPITSKPKQNYADFDDDKQQWEDEKPLNTKSQNQQKDNAIKNKKKKSVVKKQPQNYDEQIENEFTTPSEDRPIQAKGQYAYQEQEIKQEIENEFNNTDKPKKKKQDPKAIENLKKRTKYDPRKAIEDAKKKQELEQQEVPQEEEIIVKQPVKPTQKQQSTPKKRDKTPEITKTPPKQIINNQEASPRDELNSSFDNKPKNFLKRKSKQVPLNNPKIDPKAIKSKVKNCWNGEEGEVDVSEDIHMSPKAYVNTKSPSKRFLEKTEKPVQQQQQQQQDQKQFKQQQQQQIQQQQQQQKQSRVISLDELEKAYNVNYSQKFESIQFGYVGTMKNLQNIIEQRIKIPQGVPVISNKSRFYQSFKLSEFDVMI